MRHLIVTADDFGLAREVNEAVEAASRIGILSAASLIIAGAAAADAVRRARRLPNLHVGLHIVLVDGTPAAARALIPDLVDDAGRLRGDLLGLSLDIACSPTLRRQLRTEITAQFERYRRTGLPLDHVDVHKHFHLHPSVMREVLAIGGRFGMRAMRIPVEPAAVLRRIERTLAMVGPQLTSAWASLLRATAQCAELVTPDAVLGLAWSGAMTRARITGLIENLPSGLVEIYTHPATANGFAGCERGYRYADELEALCAPDAIAAVRRSGFSLGSYSDASARAASVAPPRVLASG